MRGLPQSLPPHGAEAPEEADVMMSSDDSSQAFRPPARIAARIYKPASARRKTSAASSRRNSISSTHSHASQRSHQSYHGPQSSHIAQHLRRASILESRKARLADRAAHAEKVRLRAAMAKALPRASNSEERALAAQQARERYLAQVAASCAEEVKRAKKVAGDMKEKREADRGKLKGDMEERLAEAERRRAEYQRTSRRPRASSFHTINEQPHIKGSGIPLDETQAAVHIQSAWRTRIRHQTLKSFLALGLSIDDIREQSFEDVGSKLAADEVLSGTTNMLKLCGIQEGDGASGAEKAVVRTFLSAFLILGHPAQVLSHNGDQEQDLMTKSRDLLISFEHVISSLGPANAYNPLPTQQQALTESFDTFFTAFSAWKTRDSSTLVNTMLDQYVELDLIWQKIKNESEEAVKEEYRTGIRDNQILLIAKIKRLAGPEKAKIMISKAIRDGRKARATQKLGDVRPRASSSKAFTEQPLPQSSTQADSVPTVDSEVKRLEPRITSTPHWTRQSDAFKETVTQLPDNRILVHELAVNREFNMENSDGATPKQREQRKKRNSAIFNAMRYDIDQGNGDGWILAMVDNIRSRLLYLLSQTNPIRTPITEVLDQEVIRNKLSIGAFSYEEFFTSVNKILPQMCAPARDSEVKDLAEDQSSDYILRLKKLFKVIDHMSLDHANFILAKAAPYLIKEAPEYENRRFAEQIAEGNYTLERTEKWWRASREKAFAEASRRDPEGINHPANRPSAERIYMQGLTELAFSHAELFETDIPETLCLDTDRLQRMRTESLHIVSAGAILLTAKNLLKRDVRSQWKSEASQIFAIISSTDTLVEPSSSTSVSPSTSTSSIRSKTTRILSTITSTHALPPATSTQLETFTTRILTQLSTRSPTDPVMRLLFHRLRTHVFSRLSATSTGDRVRLASTASEGLAASGLPEFVGRIGEMVDLLVRVGELDRVAHASWYETVAGGIEEGRNTQ